MRVEILNEQHLRLLLDDCIDVGAVEQHLRTQLGSQCFDIVTAYHGMLLHINPAQTDVFQVQELVRAESAQFHALTRPATQENMTLDIPVCYDRRLGIDLIAAAECVDLSVDEFVHRHHEPVYLVQAMGFSPGFAYLGDLDERLRLPRLDQPRSSVPAGSVAIAEQQTAVYPLSTPGGWRIIGRSPQVFLNFEQDPITQFKIGLSVKFCPISFEEYLEAGGEL